MSTYSAMIGKVATEVRGCAVGSEEMTIECGDVAFRFHHEQDCCEYVTIQQIDGDPADLVGTPILMAEEVDGPEPEGFGLGPFESHTWTFYKFGTEKGYVTVRWLGESNGYYSEGVEFSEVRAA